jgi:aquaporin Z
MKKYTVEFIGTFFLVAGAILYGAIGATLALMVMIYAGGHISGAHYNPAVTVAMYIRRKILSAEMPGYFAAQFLGAAVAALLAVYVFGIEGTTVNDCNNSLGSGVLKTFVAEVIGTFALAYVVLNVATARGTANNSFYGLAIAGTVLAMAVAFGQFSGGVFNPAVGFGLAIQKSVCWVNLWLFFAAPLVGGALAAYTFLSVNGAEEEVESIPDDRTIGKEKL